MTIRELYEFFDAKIPQSLSLDWDNDGLMCCPDENKPVRRVLIALDVTGEAVKTALAGNYDAVISHHPMIFHPLNALDPSDPVAKKAIALIRGGVAVMSFHTRLDAAAGGVNDTLAKGLGLRDVSPLGEGEAAVGRIGYLPAPMTLDEFAGRFKKLTGAPAVEVADAGKPVYRVALLGGGGEDFVRAAELAGADTFLTGELKHHQMSDAPERGMNLVKGGHFYTENPVCARLAELVREADPSVTVDFFDSHTNRFI